MSIVKDKLELWKFRKKWRRLNKNNTTIAINIFNPEYVKVGNYTYGPLKILNYATTEKISIGNYCSIAGNVTFILNADHNIDTISTFPFKVKYLGEKYEGTSKGDIVVCDDVWIGYGSTILSGIKIGQGAVIAAGSVVTKDVEPYSVVGGVPAKTIKMRFSDDIIKKLEQIDFSKINVNNTNISYFYKNIDENNIDEVIEKIFKK